MLHGSAQTCMECCIIFFLGGGFHNHNMLTPLGPKQPSSPFTKELHFLDHGDNKSSKVETEREREWEGSKVRKRKDKNINAVARYVLDQSIMYQKSYLKFTDKFDAGFLHGNVIIIVFILEVSDQWRHEIGIKKRRGPNLQKVTFLISFLLTSICSNSCK